MLGEGGGGNGTVGGRDVDRDSGDGGNRKDGDGGSDGGDGGSDGGDGGVDLTGDVGERAGGEITKGGFGSSS